MKKLLLLIAVLLTVSSWAQKPKIYLNPGHGGYNSNDRNIVTIKHEEGDQSGFWESQANLTKALYLREMLQTAGATVYMSRTDNRSGYRDDTSLGTAVGDRPLSTIAREASNKADFFLSIHSNASGNSTSSATNYLLLMLTGTSGSSDWSTSYKYAEAVTAANYALNRMGGHPMTWWNSNSQRMYSYTTYTVISPSYLTIPGYLSEGEFHDYKPETHRLLNTDYCKLEAYRLLQAFCDYYSSELTPPTTGVICGDVRDQTATMTGVTKYQLAKDDDNYKPLNGAKVKLKKDGVVIATYTCDDEWNGFYAFWNLEPGNYQVQCAANDHASVTKDLTVTANTITYNRVKLGPGSGDGMSDVTVSPLGMLYDTLMNSAATTALNTLTLRRVLVKDDTLYALTSDSHILLINAHTGETLGEINTTGITGSERNIGDIGFTDDNVLIACTQEHTTSDGSVKMKVYTWADNNAAPVQLFQSGSSANLFDASVGRSIAIKGTKNQLRLFSLAFSLQSKGVRLLQHTWDGSSVTTIRNNNTSCNTLGDTAVWKTAQLTASPYRNTEFLINSKTIYPAMLTFVQTDGNTFSKTEYTHLAINTSGGSFVRYQDHILYLTPYGSDNVGVGIYEATEGLSAASLIKTLFPTDTLPLNQTGYMTAAAQVDAEEMVVTLFTQNRGICRWRVSTNDLEQSKQQSEPEPVLAGRKGADIFASELTMASSGDIYTFSYRLNEDATDVTLQLLYEDAVIQQKSVGAQAKGAQSLSIDSADILWPERHNDDHLAWAIKATAEPINAISKLSNDDTPYQFYRPFGVAVDNNPESEFFGRVYVTNTKTGKCSAGRTTANRLFAFDAGLNALNTTAYTGGVAWNDATTNGNSPFRLNVAPDGRVFLCDWSDAHSGIWIAPQGGITGSFTQLFQGTNDGTGICTNTSGDSIHGSISACWVEGTGADTKLYTMDEDYLVGGKPGNMLRYDIGESTSWDQKPSAVAFNNAANDTPIVNWTLKMVSDQHGGWWIIQYRYAENSQQPSLIHVQNGLIDYNTGGEQLLDNSRNGGLAVNQDGSRIATTSQQQINVWDVTYKEDGSFESISPAFEITKDTISGLGASSNDVAFDPAGNLYYVSNTSERLVVIGLPKAENSFVTAARSVFTIPLPVNSIPTAIDSDPSDLSDSSTRKFIKDGQLFIKRDGRIYTVTGQLVQ